jgi:hypothetical protein
LYIGQATAVPDEEPARQTQVVSSAERRVSGGEAIMVPGITAGKFGRKFDAKLGRSSDASRRSSPVLTVASMMLLAWILLSALASWLPPPGMQ